MDIIRAKEIIREFLEYNIDEDIKILGRDHPYEICDCIMGEIEEAYDMISDWFDIDESVMGNGSINDQYEFNKVEKK